MASHRWLSCLIPLSLSLPLVSASFHCDIVVDKHKFDLTPLKGMHSIVISEDTPPSITNFTWQIDPCAPLKKDQDTPSVDSCPVGTQVCGIVTTVRDSTSLVQKVIPIAGDLHGNPLDADITLLSTQKTPHAAPVQGVRVHIKGGEYVQEKQSAIVEFLCDRAVDIGDPEYVSYREGILRLEWRTRHACFDALGQEDGDVGKGRDRQDDRDPQTSSHWGFLTWFLIIMFLAIAAYLIFAGFLNYSRYGASSAWSLLPTEALRDVPYIVKDFFSSVVTTVKGGGSGGGGYSSV